MLQDTSSNGTYINDNERPLGNQNPHELKSGDVIRIGEYHVQVQIDSATDFSLDDSALYKTGSTSTRAAAWPQPKDLGASPAPRESARGQQRHLERRTQTRQRIRPGGFGAHARAASDAGPAEGTFDRARTRRRLRGRGAPHRAPGQGRGPSNSRRCSSQPRCPRPRRRRRAYSRRPPWTTRPGLQAFCRGAGIGPETLPVDAHSRMLHLAGQLLRESLLGLKESNRSQQEQRNQLRVTYQKDARRSAALARASQRRRTHPGIAQGARQPPLRRRAMVARIVRRQPPPRRRR